METGKVWVLDGQTGVTLLPWDSTIIVPPSPNVALRAARNAAASEPSGGSRHVGLEEGWTEEELVTSHYRPAEPSDPEAGARTSPRDDDALAELYMSGERPSEEALGEALRRATLANKVVPVLCGAALRNRGVQPLLDAVVDYLPSPTEILPVRGENPRNGEPEERPADDKAPFCGLAFKVAMVEGRKAVYVRIYSGTLNSGDDVFNPRLGPTGKEKEQKGRGGDKDKEKAAPRGRTEKISRLFSVHADSRDKLEKAGAGTIVLAMGLRDTATGDTLCSPQHPIALERIDVLDQVEVWREWRIAAIAGLESALAAGEPRAASLLALAYDHGDFGPFSPRLAAPDPYRAFVYRRLHTLIAQRTATSNLQNEASVEEKAGASLTEGQRRAAAADAQRLFELHYAALAPGERDNGINGDDFAACER